MSSHIPRRFEGFGLAVAALGLLAGMPSQAQTWKPMGPLGGDVRSLAADPSHPERVYLGTTDGYVFGSHDAGNIWERLGLAGSINAVVTAIVVDPRDSGIVFAASWTREKNGEGGGVSISGDGGRTWHESGLVGHAVRALAQAPSEPNRLVAGALDGIFVSHDLGRSWERISPAGDSELRNFDSLAIDPQNPAIIYAGTFHLAWKTTDEGKHWQPIHGGMLDDSDVLSLTMDARNPQRIFAGACSGIYRSDHAGLSWKKLEGMPDSSRRTPVIRQDLSAPAVLYAGTTKGLWKSKDDGATWRRVSSDEWSVNAILIEPILANQEAGASASGERVLLGTEMQGVLASDDGGEHFEPANAGFRHRHVVSMAMDRDRTGHMTAVLGNAPETLVETENGGRSWSALGKGLNSNGVRKIYSSPNGWWAALDSGGLARFDPGQSVWVRVGTISENKMLAGVNSANPPARGKLAFEASVNDIAFGDREWFAATEEGLFMTRDSGVTWFAVPAGAAGLPIRSVRVSADAQRLRIVSAAGMLFSDDAGVSWEWHDLPPGSGDALRLEWAVNNTLLAAARNGLYVSRDGGANWRKLQQGLPAVAADDLLIRPGLWLVSLQTGGLFASRDAGANWLRLSEADGIAQDLEFPILMSENETGLVYVSSSAGELYESDQLGDSAAGNGTVLAGK